MDEDKVVATGCFIIVLVLMAIYAAGVMMGHVR